MSRSRNTSTNSPVFAAVYGVTAWRRAQNESAPFVRSGESRSTVPNGNPSCCFVSPRIRRAWSRRHRKVSDLSIRTAGEVYFHRDSVLGGNFGRLRVSSRVGFALSAVCQLFRAARVTAVARQLQRVARVVTIGATILAVFGRQAVTCRMCAFLFFSHFSFASLNLRILSMSRPNFPHSGTRTDRLLLRLS